MHYSNGLGLVVSVVGAFSVTGDRPLAVAARVLLDAAGLCFGIYLIAVVGLTVAGRRLPRRTAAGGPPRSARHGGTITPAAGGMPR